MKRGLPLSILLDEGAPAPIGVPFRARGHTVINHSDVLSPGASDRLVCATAIMNSAILVAVDRDMKQMAKRFGTSEKGGRYGRMNLLFLNCSGLIAPKRAEHLMSFIEHEWRVTCEKSARTMWIDIGPHYFRSYR